MPPPLSPAVFLAIVEFVRVTAAPNWETTAPPLPVVSLSWMELPDTFMTHAKQYRPPAKDEAWLSVISLSLIVMVEPLFASIAPPNPAKLWTILQRSSVTEPPLATSN